MKYNDIKILTKEDSGTEPLTLAEVKNHLRVTFDTDDTYLAFLIKAVRIEFEEKENKSYVSKTITAYVRNEIGSTNLLYPPIADISSFIDSNSEEITNYVSVNGEIMTKVTGTIEYTTTGTVNYFDKMRMLERIAYRYEHRGDEEKTKAGTWLV